MASAITRNQISGGAWRRERSRETQDADEASADIEAVTLDPVREAVERTAQRLSRADEHERDQDEEGSDDDSIGTENWATSGLRYSVPKKTSCGEA